MERGTREAKDDVGQAQIMHYGLGDHWKVGQPQGTWTLGYV